MSGKVAKRIRKQSRNMKLQNVYEQKEYKALFGRRSAQGLVAISPVNRSFYKYLKRQYKAAA